jgi:hypothetical protein
MKCHSKIVSRRDIKQGIPLGILVNRTEEEHGGVIEDK